MDKKYIPAVITLAAGLIDCLMCIGKGMTNMEYVRQLLIVLVVFFIFGMFVRFLVDKGLGALADKEKEEGAEPDGTINKKENLEESLEDSEEE